MVCIGCERSIFAQSHVISVLTTSSPRPTYASVLNSHRQHQSSTEPQPTLTTFSYSLFSLGTPAPDDRCSPPSLTSSPTLTVEDPRNRFHNKASPFKPAGANQKHTNRNHLTVVATEALSNFPLLAFPAFSGFLSNIRKGSYRYPSPDQGFCSRRPTGLHE
jgi:hypothetical protein